MALGLGNWRILSFSRTLTNSNDLLPWELEDALERKGKEFLHLTGHVITIICWFSASQGKADWSWIPSIWKVPKCQLLWAHGLVSWKLSPLHSPRWGMCSSLTASHKPSGPALGDITRLPQLPFFLGGELARWLKSC